jgi:para-nitrobenzyl esterase
MLKKICLVGIFLIGVGAPADKFSQPSAATVADLTIRIESGLISGALVGENKDVRAYKGIPYAAPPVGNLRWKPPQPPPTWQGVRQTTEYGPSCPQPDILERAYGIKTGPTSEDCLYLNVWTPAKVGNEKLPVMVWIHGGGYIAGSGSSQVYDGQELARRGIVVVTINYRLGPFGFLAHPLLSKESEHGVSGNYGLLDQIAALLWVKRNIAAFGGDPNNVTIFGESAGAGSVCYLMVSPLAKGLFHRAIAQSGSAFGPNRHLRQSWYGLEPAEKLGERFAERLGCSGLAEMRANSAEQILAKSGADSNFFFSRGDRFSPIVDGWVVPDDPATIFEAGKQHKVPLIVGSNQDEGTIFTASMPQMGIEQYKAIIRTLYGEHADQVFALYRADRDDQVRKALSQLIGDSAFIANARYFARVHGRASKAFLYHFTRVRPDSRGAALGAFHGSEIAYAFGNIKVLGAHDDQDRALAQMMSSYWTQFARTGDPNAKGLPHWPAYDPKADRHIELGDAVSTKSGLRKEACDLFEKISAERRAKRMASSPSR